MRIVPAMLLLPALAGAAFSQTTAPEPPKPPVEPVQAIVAPQSTDLPQPSVEGSRRVWIRVPAPAVEGRMNAIIGSAFRRVRVRVPAPAPQRCRSVDAVFQPLPQGLVDAHAATKFRRFLIEVHRTRSQCCPMPCSATACPAADPFATKPAQPRIAKTIHLKYVSCAEAHRRLKAKFEKDARACGKTSPKRSKMIVVPEPVSNNLLVIGTAKQIEELQKTVKDVEPPVDVYQIVVTRIGPDGKKTVISRPQVRAVRGTEARVEVGQEGGTVFKMSLRVDPVSQARPAKVYPHPPLAAVNDRCFDGRIGLVPPPAPGVSEERKVIRTVGHIAVLNTPPAPASAAERKGPRLQVRAYPVADVLDGTDHRAGAEALMQVIRMTVDPSSWSKKDGYGTIRYFPKTLSLVIRQSVDAHRRISELLKKLRAIRNSQ